MEESTVLTTMTLSVSCLPSLCLLAQVHFHTLSELKAHATLLHNTDLSVCSQCPLVFVRDTSLVVHVREAHGGINAKSYRCKTCDSKFDNKRLLMFHKRHVCLSACACVCVREGVCVCAYVLCMCWYTCVLVHVVCLCEIERDACDESVHVCMCVCTLSSLPTDLQKTARSPIKLHLFTLVSVTLTHFQHNKRIRPAHFISKIIIFQFRS